MVPDIDNYNEYGDFWYNDSKVALLKDVTVAQGETLEANSTRSIWLNLNGHTFNVQGTFTGGYDGVSWQNGEYQNVFYPTNIQIVSTTTGTFRSSGTLGVNLEPWTEDTYYITGGTINGEFFADGGTYTWRVKPLNILYGDVNGDGIVSIRDATLVQMYLAQMVEFDAAQLLAADADGNGTVDINDVTRIQQYLVGMIDSLR